MPPEPFLHPVLGLVEPIAVDGVTLTVMTVVDWERPTRIPAIEAPAKLPPGLGARMLNDLAERAVAAGIPALRYAGPYPTSALYHSLLRSFRTAATEAEFTADALGRALRGATDELPFEFAPAPHRRVEHARGHAELRDGVERVVIDGAGYARDGGAARLIGDRAEVWFGDARWAHVATVDAGGQLVDGPQPIPRCTSDAVGAAFPPALRAAIAELVAEAVPAPLAADARRVLTERAIRWADLGARLARRTTDGFEVHAALWERLHPAGLARVALALAEALAPVVAQAVIADVELMSPPRGRGDIL